MFKNQLLVTLGAALSLTTSVIAGQNLILRYDQPASSWNEAIPMGNGSLGAMLHGGVNKSIINLNEDTLWSGEPSNVLAAPPAYSVVMKLASALLKKGKYAEADELVRTQGLGKLGQAYQPVGSIELDFHHSAPFTNYTRSLDLRTAVHSVSYTQDGIHFTREAFVSYPDKVIYYRLKADRPKALHLTVSFTSPHPTAHSSALAGQKATICMQGQAPAFIYRRPLSALKRGKSSFPPNYPELCRADDSLRFPDKKEGILYADELDGQGMFYEAQVRVLKTDGTASVKPSGELEIRDASEIVLAVGVATSYNGSYKSPSREGKEPRKLLAQRFSQLKNRNYEAAKKSHIADYQKLFNSCQLTLGKPDETENLSTRERLLDHAGEPSFAALMFQYGRYLLISSSRPGSQPANLQGIWSRKVFPPWNSNYTTNINVEMNYWPAEVTGLSECHQPLFKMIEESIPNGKRSARDMYGIKRGWVMHHNTSIWRETGPTDGTCMWFPWPMGSGWLCSHLWEHYAYTQDEKFLRKRAYPVMKQAAEFYADWLVLNRDGYYVTPVSTSPENQFLTKEGKAVSLAPGATMDLAIIRELFSRTIYASRLLGIDADLRHELETKLKKILPYQIGKFGQLQEWSKDFKERDQHHRHISHLYALHPSDQITLEKTPKLFAAARQTLIRRGDEATGWSMGWKINMWARMRDGDHAHKILKNLFQPAILPKGMRSKRYHKGSEYAGLYFNLLDAHPPFQIDGNFGFTAGVAEMLVQSHRQDRNGVYIIDILPALPKAWSQGEVRGLHTRGGFVVDIRWKNHRATEIVLTPLHGKQIKVHYLNKSILVKEKTTIRP